MASRLSCADSVGRVTALDGHESHARRHCPGCLERTLRTGQTKRTQYYHRQATLMLLPGSRPSCDRSVRRPPREGGKRPLSHLQT